MSVKIWFKALLRCKVRSSSKERYMYLLRNTIKKKWMAEIKKNLCLRVIGLWSYMYLFKCSCLLFKISLSIFSSLIFLRTIHSSWFRFLVLIDGSHADVIAQFFFNCSVIIFTLEFFEGWEAFSKFQLKLCHFHAVCLQVQLK